MTWHNFGDYLWITSVIRTGSTAFISSAPFREPCLQCLLRAAGKSIRSVYRAAVGQNRAGVAIEALDGGGPAPATDRCIFGFTQRLGKPVSFAFRLGSAYDKFVAYCLGAFVCTERDEKRNAFRRSGCLCRSKRWGMGERRGHIGPRRSNEYSQEDIEFGNSDTPAKVCGQRSCAL